MKKKETINKFLVADFLLAPCEPTEDTIQGCFKIAKADFSDMYTLPTISYVTGIISSIVTDMRRLREGDQNIVEEVCGKQLDFVCLSPKIGKNDWLFVTKHSWEEVLRDYGILPDEGFTFSLSLTELIYEE